MGRTRRSGSRNTRRRALSGGPDQTPRHRSSRALNVARFPIFTADQTRCRGRGPGRAAVCRADEKQTEYKSPRTRRELATTPAWVLSRGIKMAKTENRNMLYLLPLPRRIVGRISFAAFESKSLHRRYCIVRIGWSLSCVALRHTRKSSIV